MAPVARAKLFGAALAALAILAVATGARGNDAPTTSWPCARGEPTRCRRALSARAVLEVPAGTDEVRAQRLLEKVEETCLITNSLAGDVALESEIRKAS